MSWSFEFHGKDKDKLKAAAESQIKSSASYSGGEEAIKPAIALMHQAIDVAVLPSSADHFKVKGHGHAAIGCAQGSDKKSLTELYFSIEVMPVYLPKLVD